MASVFYVTNTSVRPAFRYAHPRSYESPVTLYLFDYCTIGSPRRLVYEGWTSGQPSKPTRREALSEFTSLRDLYLQIRAIGRTDAGSVTALHFFTHGSPEQGISCAPYGESTRAQFDRVLKRGTERGDEFRAAFASDAIVKLWGCGIQPPAKRLTLGYWATQSRSKRLTIQQRVEARIRGMYALRLSELLDLTVWATPPGWKAAMDLPPGAPYVDFWDEKTGPMPGSMWWRVSPEFVKGRGADFYRKVLQAEIDPLGYVGINHDMSVAGEPQQLLKAEAPAEGTEEPLEDDATITASA